LPLVAQSRRAASGSAGKRIENKGDQSIVQPSKATDTAAMMSEIAYEKSSEPNVEGCQRRDTLLIAGCKSESLLLGSNSSVQKHILLIKLHVISYKNRSL
jgi:hypothetical protein